jgi:uncharacterized protein (TIGR02145 family)
MGLAIGNRSGVPLRTGHISGLNAIPIRHGIPFQSEADLYVPPLRMRTDPVSINFTATGKLSGNLRPISMVGSSNITFGSTGRLIGIPGRIIPPDSLFMKPQENWINFSATGKMSRKMNMKGVAWMVFYDIKGKLTAVPVSLGYGLLYNRFAVETGVLTPTGWHIADVFEMLDFDSFILSNFGKLKEAGLSHWITPNTGATNETGFTLLPGGYRDSNGEFSLIGEEGSFWFNNIFNNTNWVGGTYYNSLGGGALGNDLEGRSVRPIKDSTTLSDGQVGTVIDIDGNIYPTICLGTQEWFASNLKVTKYNDGTPIPEVTDNDEWAALTSGALCAYNNDHNNI